ncbi:MULTISPECIES: type I phosphomannose isomerase catalytic subunit [unclassified Lentimicrobium]|uniref:type I phosphomannose isomerase catalytic subunit n=1 Tax=unclassified Lentimicrobium TaxID=2677434 RepID=UPI00155282F0|nr:MULTISPECIES: type I phosphomannose isomerase catalytic subunit [unclassified Lentimicrobium]NPD46363.1 class I mannose-6-phosphate isomerase [Lentimicrobium sp. S6]NPD84998.1 class I mannose-6-phosphate isomerase [Lentimicrobium sp. L6]
MSQSLYPFEFKPIFKEKIWGGQRIKNSFGFDTGELKNCGELWSLSGYETEQSTISNGFLAGNELNDLIEIYMDELVGGNIYQRFGNTFPILVKILDAEDWLSIQVHPDDELAIKRGMEGGKTEMWYILEADKNAQLIAGFSQKVNENVYLRKIEEKKLSEIMNFEEVKKEDVFYMPSGRVHALGPGILLAEIQQTSDTTYRIYDWDRVDEKGQGRALHLKEAMEAIDFELYDNYKTEYQKKLNETNEIINNDFFTTNLLELDQGIQKDYSELDSFVILLAVEGSFNYTDKFGNYGFIKAGESLLIPAAQDNINILPDGKCKILEVYIIDVEDLDTGNL